MPTALPDSEAIVELGDVIVIGGGCYGTFYTGQLETARARSKVRYRRIMVVDRDPHCQVTRDLPPDTSREVVVAEWGEFLNRYLGDAADRQSAGPDDVIVPSPLMPHLMYEWLLRRARARWPKRTVETTRVNASPHTPYDATAPDHTRYISFADWICPTHCIEPALCPVIHGPRTWEMADALADLTTRLNRGAPTAGPVLFQCRHTVFAVGTFSVAAVIEGDRLVTAAGEAGDAIDLVVGTISSCHGAVNVLRLGGMRNG
ncbi:MAG: hypothetical protein ABI679_03710 [Gemmatimonadota bacterium]